MVTCPITSRRGIDGGRDHGGAHAAAGDRAGTQPRAHGGGSDAGEAWLARGSIALRAAAPALVGYALVRIVGLLVLIDVVRERNLGLVEALTGWDAGWYLQIAERGYDRRLLELADGRIDYTNLAFFPLYPGLIKGLTLAGLPPEIAGLAISLVAGLAAA